MYHMAQGYISCQLFNFCNQLRLSEGVAQNRKSIDTLAYETRIEICTWQQKLQVL